MNATLTRYASRMVDDHAWAYLCAQSRDTFGMVTVTQAQSADIGEKDLEQAAAAGLAWRTPDRLWVVDDVGIFQIEDLAAAWLAIDPDTPITARRQSPETIITHQSAAVIRDLGDITTDYLTVTTPNLRSNTPTMVRQHIGELGVLNVDWDLVEGLPVATPARIITDLAGHRGVDGSHLGAVLATTLDDNLLSPEQITELLGPHAWRWTDHPERGGRYVMDMLIASAFG